MLATGALLPATGRLRFLLLVTIVAVAALDVRAQAPHPAVCRVIAPERDGTAFGSGTLIDARGQYGLVVTNWHVVRDATGPIQVAFPDGFQSEGRPLKLDEHWDLAALVVWRPATEPVRIASGPPRPGEPLVICGYGQGDYRAAAGRCTRYYAPEAGMPEELVELSVEARQGDSGGPIFNSHGELAGVLFGAGRGTTLGSFAPRVHSFLATLAPGVGTGGRGGANIARGTGAAGVGSPTSAVSPIVSARGSDASRRGGPMATDPFLIADSQRAERLDPVAKPIRPQGVGKPFEAWPTASHQSQPPSVANVPLIDFGPSVAPIGLPPTDPAAVDWSEDSRTLLALAGFAAVAVHAVKLFG